MAHFARFKTRAAAEAEAAAIRKAYAGHLSVAVEAVPSRSRPGQTSYAVTVRMGSKHRSKSSSVSKNVRRASRRRVSRNVKRRTSKAVVGTFHIPRKGVVAGTFHVPAKKPKRRVSKSRRRTSRR